MSHDGKNESAMHLDYNYFFDDELIIKSIYNPTKEDLNDAISICKHLQHFGVCLRFKKEKWTVLISPAIDDSEFEDEEYLQENEADRIHIQMWDNARSHYLKLIDVNSSDYQNEITYSDGVFMWDYMYRSVPFEQGVKYILQIYEKTRLKNYFRELDMAYFKTIDYYSHYFGNKLIRLNTPEVDDIVQILEDFKPSGLQRLYLQFARRQIFIHSVENHQRVIITNFQ